MLHSLRAHADAAVFEDAMLILLMIVAVIIMMLLQPNFCANLCTCACSVGDCTGLDLGKLFPWPNRTATNGNRPRADTKPASGAGQPPVGGINNYVPLSNFDSVGDGHLKRLKRTLLHDQRVVRECMARIEMP